MTLATELGKRIVAMRYEDLPAEAVRWAKISFVDTIACAFAGTHEKGPGIVEKVLTAGKGGGTSLIWGSDRRASALDAAAINGIAAHAHNPQGMYEHFQGRRLSPAMERLTDALCERIAALRYEDRVSATQRSRSATRL